MISVCIATYNGAKYIKRQLESILSQLSDEDEIIVSDDGSTDATLQIIEGFKSPLISIYKNQGEHGYTPNFENAITHAKGEYVFLSDQDDVWLPNKVQRCLSVLERYDVVISDAKLVDSNEREIHPSFFALRKPNKGFWGNLYKCGYIGCCIAFRRRILERALPFPANRKCAPHDFWIVMLSSFYYKVKVVNDKLILYRRHGDNASVGPYSEKGNNWFRIKYRLYLLINVLLRCK